MRDERKKLEETSCLQLLLLLGEQQVRYRILCLVSLIYDIFVNTVPE